MAGDNAGWLYSVETQDPNVGSREFGLRTQVRRRFVECVCVMRRLTDDIDGLAQVTSITRSGPMCM